MTYKIYTATQKAKEHHLSIEEIFEQREIECIAEFVDYDEACEALDKYDEQGLASEYWLV